MKIQRFILLTLTLLLSMVVAYGQEGGAIKGTVIDENDEPVIGATVRLKADQKVGATTDLDGNFQIKAKVGDLLMVSYVGYQTVEIKAANGMTIKITPDSELLGEVVVTGMVAQDKRLFTGATDQLSGEKIKLDGVADVSRGLEGRSAGVSVQNVSGTFGTAPKIRVRGATSIYGNSTPLWVVDGVIQENIVDVGPDDLSSGDAATLISNAIAGLNPDDIESFQILKDGSATSIYGAKAMAGVIVITTKKGREGTASLSYTGEFTTRLVPTYDEFNIMNSQDQMGIYMELHKKGFLNFAETYRSASSGIFGKMYQLINQYDPVTHTFGLPNTLEGKTNYLRNAELRNTDWFKELFSPAVMMNHSISASMGTKKSQTYASLSVMTDPGWMEASKVSRYTANVNNTYHITDKLSTNIIGNVSFRKQMAPGTLGQAVDPVNGTVSRTFDINPYSYAINSGRTLDPNESYQRNYAPFNIHNELANNYMDLRVLDTKFQGLLEYKPFKGMTLQGVASLNYSTAFTEDKITENSNRAMAYRAMDDAEMRRKNSWLYSDPDNPNALPISVLPQGGFYDVARNEMFSTYFRGSLQYNTVLDEVHIFNTYAGLEFTSQKRSQNAFNGWGMQYDHGETAFWVPQAFKQMKEQNTPYYALVNTLIRSNAYFATATYSYNGIYTLNGTFRYEGTNLLGTSRTARWLPTWNVSGAWNASDEPWFNDDIKKVLSHLTLKTSYSLTADAGNLSMANADLIIKANTPWRPSAAQTSETALRLEALANEDLTYEKKHEFNVGADLGFLNNRINLAVDWYTRNNFDLIGVINTEGVGGMNRRFGNVATMKSHGVEVSLSTRNIETKDFQWTTDFIFGYNTNQVTSLDTRTQLMNFITGTGFAREGYPVRSLFSIPFAGLDNNGLPTFRGRDNLLINHENYYSALNFQESDPEKLDFLKYEGPTDPTINGSFGNIFSYKNFRLNVFITYSGGNVIRLDPIFSSTYNDLMATPKEFENRWRFAGDQDHTDIPVIANREQVTEVQGIRQAYSAYNYSTARVAKGDFIRLKEVSLTYNFPKKWIEKLALSNASLKLQGTNLWLLYSDSKLNGQDPEFFRAGGVSAPVPRQFTATVRLGF